MASDTTKADAFRIRPEDPHWPLVVMTTLTQTSVGALASLLIAHIFRPTQSMRIAAAGALVVALIALNASTLHLGRPAFAWRALSMWKRSWLSREVLLFSLFAGLGTLYAASLWWNVAFSDLLGGLAELIGVGAVFASARLYTVKARPVWNSKFTFGEFYLSAALSGTLFAALFLREARQELHRAAAIAALSIIVLQLAKLLWLALSKEFECELVVSDDVAAKAGGKLAVIAPLAFEAVKRIDAIFDVEREINGRSITERLAVRRARVAPLVSELETWMRKEYVKLSRHSDVAKAMNYMLKRWDTFTRFLDDGRICITNNAAERALRGIALGRKSWLFAGSDRGGERAAVMLTLIQTAKLNDIDPQAWLADVLARLPDHPAKRIHELLPWDWRRKIIAAKAA
jgi:DMSO reductase anchor subunit